MKKSTAVLFLASMIAFSSSHFAHALDFTNIKKRNQFSVRRAEQIQTLANLVAMDVENTPKSPELDTALGVNELLKEVAVFSHPANACIILGSQQIPQSQREDLTWKRNHSEALTVFYKNFVFIPEGDLPIGNMPMGLPKGENHVESFEAGRFAVTRRIWNLFMGGMPAAFLEKFRQDGKSEEEALQAWNSDLDLPVTYVNWENYDGSRAEVQTFLATVNQRLGDGCTYDLPTDKQLWYQNRADRTGENKDQYSAGVTRQNLNDYVTHAGNSNNRIPRVGSKKLNKFGVSIGDGILKMSKDLSNQQSPEQGRSIRGGSWIGLTVAALSVARFRAFAGNRSGDMGFSLVRTCR